MADDSKAPWEREAVRQHLWEVMPRQRHFTPACWLGTFLGRPCRPVAQASEFANIWLTNTGRADDSFGSLLILTSRKLYPLFWPCFSFFAITLLLSTGKSRLQEDPERASNSGGDPKNDSDSACLC